MKTELTDTNNIYNNNMEIDEPYELFEEYRLNKKNKRKYVLKLLILFMILFIAIIGAVFVGIIFVESILNDKLLLIVISIFSLAIIFSIILYMIVFIKYTLSNQDNY